MKQESIFDSKNKIWSATTYESIYNVITNLGVLILNVLKNTPERVTQVSADTGAEVTCQEMRIRTMKIVKHLMDEGFKQGEIVGIIASNSENVAPVFFACLTLGLPINTLAPVMVESDIVHMYSKTKPKVVFCDAEIIDTVRGAMEKIGRKSRIYTLMRRVDDHECVDEILKIEFDERNFVWVEFPNLRNINSTPAVILCSSGTTGSPKGVCKSHSQLITNLHRMWDVAPSQGQEVYFNFSTLYWGTGVNFLITATLYGGKRVITTKPFDPELMVDIIERHNVTVTLAPPSSVAYMLQNNKMRKLPSLKVFMPSGSIVSKILCEALSPYIGDDVLCPAYGCSEGDVLAGSFSCKKFGSVGKLVNNTQIKIIDESGRHLGPNEEGEICFKPQVLFLGYFEELEKTEEAVRDGWVHTGDVGYFDDEGFLFIVDRKKDMLKFNNYQVYPAELESIINEIPGVACSCVVGVFEPDMGNDLIFGFVVKNPSISDISAKEIQDHVNSKVIDAKKLRGGIFFLEALPMTLSGKIKRCEVKQLAKNIYDGYN